MNSVSKWFDFAIIFPLYAVPYYFFSPCQHAMSSCHVLNPGQSNIYTGEQIYKCQQPQLSTFDCPCSHLHLQAFLRIHLRLQGLFSRYSNSETLDFILILRQVYSIHITGGTTSTSWLCKQKGHWCSAFF